MELEEYLYVDDRRLDTYVDQIGSPVTFEKVPVWSAKLALTGLEAAGTQQRHPRSLTRAEKITRLLNYLGEKGLLGDGRFTGREAFSPLAQPFRLETCEAVKLLIPPASAEALEPEDPGLADELFLVDEFFDIKAGRDPSELRRRRERFLRQERESRLARRREQLAGFDGINIWFSDRHQRDSSNSERRGQLVLIAGFAKDDDAGFGAWSAYSALRGLFNELRSDLKKTVLHTVSDEIAVNSLSSFEQRFLTDPLSALQSVGVKVGSYRVIKVLYRVRDAVLYQDLRNNAEEIATIGYPIFVTAEGF